MGARCVVADGDVLALHRRNRALNKELKEAERALGEELGEQNFAWLRDVRAQLLSLQGTEASIEGFEALSGRPAGGPEVGWCGWMVPLTRKRRPF
jgi:hypothetical protein